jgi:hypothetical protein
MTRCHEAATFLWLRQRCKTNSNRDSWVKYGDEGCVRRLTRKVRSDERPALGPILLHKANHHIILFLGPRSFDSKLLTLALFLFLGAGCKASHLVVVLCLAENKHEKKRNMPDPSQKKLPPAGSLHHMNTFRATKDKALVPSRQGSHHNTCMWVNTVLDMDGLRQFQEFSISIVQLQESCC